MRPVVQIAPGDRDAPAAVGPRARVVRFSATDVAEAWAESDYVCEGGDEGVAVDEEAGFEGEVEEGGLRLWGGWGWEGWDWRGGAGVGGGGESARSGVGEGGGFGFG